MTIPLFPANTTIAVLDTNVFRGLGYEAPDWLDTFDEMSKDNYTFSISDLAFGEFCHQLTSGQIGLHTFKQAIDLSERFISPKVPLFPSKTDIMGMIGARETKRPFDPDEVAATSQLAWQQLKSLAELNEEKKLQSANFFQELINIEKEEWINFFLKKVAGMNLQKPGFLQGEFDQLDRNECDPPILSTRFDFKTRHLFRKGLHFQKLTEAYDPTNEKNKNDGPDDDLLHYLAVPAYVLTNDKGIIAASRDIQSFQSNWIMKPQDFADAWTKGTLPPLVWPAIAPNRLDSTQQ